MPRSPTWRPRPQLPALFALLAPTRSFFSIKTDSNRAVAESSRASQLSSIGLRNRWKTLRFVSLELGSLRDGHELFRRNRLDNVVNHQFELIDAFPLC